MFHDQISSLFVCFVLFSFFFCISFVLFSGIVLTADVEEISGISLGTVTRSFLFLSLVPRRSLPAHSIWPEIS